MSLSKLITAVGGGTEARQRLAGDVVVGFRNAGLAVNRKIRSAHNKPAAGLLIADDGDGHRTAVAGDTFLR